MAKKSAKKEPVSSKIEVVEMNDSERKMDEKSLRQEATELKAMLLCTLFDLEDLHKVSEEDEAYIEMLLGDEDVRVEMDLDDDEE